MPRAIAEARPRACATCAPVPAAALEAERFAWVVAHTRFLIGSTAPAAAFEAMATDPLGLTWYFRCESCGATISAYFAAHAGGLWMDKIPFVRLALWPEFGLRDDFALSDSLTTEDTARLAREVASWGGVDRLRVRLQAHDRRLWSLPSDGRPREDAGGRRRVVGASF